VSHAHQLGLSYQQIPSWDAIAKLALHQNVKFVYVKMALETSRTAFVSIRKECTAILAVTTTPYSKNMKHMHIWKGQLDRALKNQLLRESA